MQNNQEEMVVRKERKEWLDWMKGTAMFLIIVSHINAPGLYTKIYTPIFLSAFFFSSGYTWNPGKSIKDYLLKKCRALVIPFFCLGLINTILACIFEGDPFFERFTNFLISRCGSWDDLWFISCLFSMNILMYAIHRLFPDYRIIMIVSCIVSLLGYFIHVRYGLTLPWQFENACIQLPLMTLGYCYKENEKYIDKLQNWYVSGLSILIYLVLCIILISPHTNIHNENLGNWVVFMAVAWFGILAYANVAKSFCNSLWFRKLLIHRFVVLCGKMTLVMYAFQSKIIFILNIIGFNKLMPQWICCIVTGVLTYCLVFIPAYIIDRFFPFIIGKKFNYSILRKHKKRLK